MGVRVKLNEIQERLKNTNVNDKSHHEDCNEKAAYVHSICNKKMPYPKVSIQMLYCNVNTIALLSIFKERQLLEVIREVDESLAELLNKGEMLSNEMYNKFTKILVDDLGSFSERHL